jgi:hypothetical protein
VYIVYDIEHNQIALEQTNFEAPGSEVYEIPSGASGIPLLSGQASSVTQVPQSHFTTIQTSSSARIPTHLDTAATAEVTLTTKSGSMSSTGGGGTAMPTSTIISTSASTSTQTATPAGSSATSKSSALKVVPMFRENGLNVLSVSILLGLAGGFCFPVL